MAIFEALKTAIVEKNIKVLKEILINHPDFDINTPFPDAYTLAVPGLKIPLKGFTALHLAVEKEWSAGIALLKVAGAKKESAAAIDENRFITPLTLLDAIETHSERNLDKLRAWLTLPDNITDWFEEKNILPILTDDVKREVDIPAVFDNQVEIALQNDKPKFEKQSWFDAQFLTRYWIKTTQVPTINQLKHEVKHGYSEIRAIALENLVKPAFLTHCSELTFSNRLVLYTAWNAYVTFFYNQIYDIANNVNIEIGDQTVQLTPILAFSVNKPRCPKWISENWYLIENDIQSILSKISENLAKIDSLKETATSSQPLRKIASDYKLVSLSLLSQCLYGNLRSSNLNLEHFTQESFDSILMKAFQKAFEDGVFYEGNDELEKIKTLTGPYGTKIEDIHIKFSNYQSLLETTDTAILTLIPSKSKHVIIDENKISEDKEKSSKRKDKASKRKEKSSESKETTSLIPKLFRRSSSNSSNEFEEKLKTLLTETIKNWLTTLPILSTPKKTSVALEQHNMSPLDFSSLSPYDESGSGKHTNSSGSSTDRSDKVLTGRSEGSARFAEGTQDHQSPKHKTSPREFKVEALSIGDNNPDTPITFASSPMLRPKAPKKKAPQKLTARDLNFSAPARAITTREIGSSPIETLQEEIKTLELNGQLSPRGVRESSSVRPNGVPIIPSFTHSDLKPSFSSSPPKVPSIQRGDSYERDGSTYYRPTSPDPLSSDQHSDDSADEDKKESSKKRRKYKK